MLVLWQIRANYVQIRTLRPSSWLCSNFSCVSLSSCNSSSSLLEIWKNLQQTIVPKLSKETRTTFGIASTQIQLGTENTEEQCSETLRTHKQHIQYKREAHVFEHKMLDPNNSRNMTKKSSQANKSWFRHSKSDFASILFCGFVQEAQKLWTAGWPFVFTLEHTAGGATYMASRTLLPQEHCFVVYPRDGAP